MTTASSEGITDAEVALKLQRANSRITEYFASLPRCDVWEYDDKEAYKTRHERSQLRVLEVCSSQDDRAALIEFLIGFTYYVLSLRQPPKQEDAHDASTVLDAFLSCECSVCVLARSMGKSNPQALKDVAAITQGDATDRDKFCAIIECFIGSQPKEETP